MKKLLQALEELHEKRPETTFWSLRFFSDGSGDLLDEKQKVVGRGFGNGDEAIKFLEERANA